ncbi:multiple sugar transport system permease protein/raffinose/stachyose/melibiose transport system permease protein [Cohnella phaseoli]|uniref:Multiple sugar transport system permease protein/raffinose/stachyose/melibiose transport system permease protein n=2 Tax=Cohnella phaseoli TaxID=456490 RepID=A0A3D9HR32_9BACL|nr:multiple sugar transport system permease protein/raffinose/stachyose/melibiose transport system permease protein [Cohnella phaseoli]
MPMRTLYAEIWKSRKAYLFLSPLFVGLLVFCYFPPLSGIYHSFFDWDSVGKAEFIGWGNYRELFRDQVFLNSIPTAFLILIPRLLIGIVVPLIMAEMIFSVTKKKMQSIYRILILLPIVAPGVVSLLIWKFIYDPTSGLAIGLMKAFGLAEPDAVIHWLGDPGLVILSIVFMGFPWIGGTSVLIYMAGLMNISTEVIESAQLDGASVWRRIWSIDIPHVMGQIRFFLIFGIISGLQDFGIQIVLTSGGPGYSTYVPGYYMYIEAFTAGRMGYASTIGTVMFAAIFLLSLLAFRMMKSDSNT